MSMESHDEVTRLWLIRHGQPQGEAQGRCYGRLDVGLSIEGRRQIARVAVRLAGVPLGAVYCSPRRRAVESAHLIAAGHSLTPTPVEGLSELSFGDFEGLTYEEIERDYPSLYQQWMESPTGIQFPNGESFTTMQHRVLEAARVLRRRHQGESLAIVSHGGVNRILLADALEMSPARIFRIGQRYAAANRIDYFDSEPLVETLNECWY
jgi:alpha-ribazole phosphatase/probable phosphoglycerate mutase